MDSEIHGTISSVLDGGVFCSDFRKILIKEVTEFAESIKEFDAICYTISELSYREQEIVIEKIG